MSSDAPVCTITENMLEAGRLAVARMIVEGESDATALVMVVFMSMLSEMEGGNVLFDYEHGDGEVFRYGGLRVQ